MPTPAPNRVFLGWQTPPLRPAVEWLAERFTRGSVLDLSGVLIVVAGSKAARTLLLALLDQAQGRRAALLPPTVLTPREVLAAVPRARPIASPAHATLAWVQVLADASHQSLSAAFTPARSADRSWRTTWERARFLRELHDELAGHAVGFDDAAQRLGSGANATGSDPAEPARWRALAELQAAYRAALRAWDLTDLYDTVVPKSREHGGVRWNAVVLVGVAELSRAVRAVIAGLADECHTLIAAPHSVRDRFDALGCVIPGAWRDPPATLPDDAVLFTESPREQAALVRAEVGRAAAVDTEPERDTIAVGVGDDEVAGALENSAGAATVSFQRLNATPADRSRPALLLAELAAFLEARTCRAWAALLRHPDLAEYLCRSGAPPRPHESWLAELDDFADDHLPIGAVESSDPRTAGLSPPAREAIGALEALVRPLTDQPARPFAAWASSITAFLRTVYRGRSFTRDEPAEFASLVALEVARAHAADLARLTGHGTAADAILAILAALGDTRVAPTPRPDAFEISRWLDLPLDPAGTVIVAGFNEGMIPGAQTSHPWLPRPVRVALGLPQPDDEFARDAYLLTALIHSRRCLRVIAGRRSAQGDPLRPSRLLLPPESEQLPSRILRFLGRGAPGTPPADGPAPRAAPPREVFRPMPRGPMPEIDSMTVTGFGAYLRSPYGFYLQHALGLREIEDQRRELDRSAFGSLIHDALRAFATGEHRDSAHAAQVRGALLDALDASARARFGARTPPAVLAQLDQARRRLAVFAEHQAERRAQGWTIVEAEWTPPARPRFSFGGAAMPLRGRIDRVDLNERTGQLAVLDYKSGSDPDPVKDHRTKAGEWTDLQLPLYRYLAAPLIAKYRSDEPVLLGYAALGARGDAIGFRPAGWTTDDLASADTAAAEVISKIRRGEFFDLGTAPPRSAVLGAVAGVGAVLPDESDDTDPSDERTIGEGA